MRVSIVQEQRFIHLAGGATFNDGSSTYSLWQRYLSHFEEVQIVGRSQLVQEVPAGYRRVDGPGVSVFHLPDFHGPGAFVRRLFPVAWTLRRAFEPQEAVILRVAGTLASLSAPLLKLRGQPFAVEVINNPLEVFGGGGVQHPLRRVFGWLFTALTRWQCRKASASQYVTRHVLQQQYPPRPGTPTFGVSDVVLPPEAFTAARTYTGPALKAVLVGSLEQWYKAPDVVLKALARLRAQGLPVTFTLVGDGRLRPEVEALARELGVWEYCTFTGQRSTPAEVRRDLAEADLFLIPSYTEGLPRALVEAMAQGLPAIGSRVGGIPELLDDEVLVQPGNVDDLVRVWGKLARDPARLTRQSQRHFAEAQTYADTQLSHLRGQFLQAVRTAVSK